MSENIKTMLSENGYRIIKSKDDEFGRTKGIVSTGNNRKYFFKAVNNSDKYGKRSLLREAYVEKKVYKFILRHKNKINGYCLRIPKTIDILSINGITCLISEYIDGKSALKLSSKEKAKVLLSTIQHVMSFTNINYNRTDVKYLENYTKQGLLFRSSLRLVKASMLNPGKISSLGICMIDTFKLINMKSSKRGLVHADINLSNIIVSGRNIYLLDWEQAGYGLTLYNAVGPYCVHWEDEDIKRQLENIILPQNFGSERSLFAIRLLDLFSQKLAKDDYKRIRDSKLLKNYLNVKL